MFLCCFRDKVGAGFSRQTAGIGNGLQLPKLFPTLEGVGTAPGHIHTVLAYALLSLVAVHVAAAIKHRYIDRQDVLPRII